MGLPSDSRAGLLITGSGGRIGRALRAIWGEKAPDGQAVLWHGRRPGPGVTWAWDIGQNPPTPLPKGLIVLHLAGATRGTEAELAENSRVTEAVCRAAVVAGALHVVVMSSAAVYAPGPDPLTEDTIPAPINPYGQSKLLAERAAQRVLGQDRLTVLRLANLAGADALLGNCRPGQTVTLDPIAGQDRGPERSYIGPHILAAVLADLIGHVSAGRSVPPLLNLAQPGVVAMADLLDAFGQTWVFGPPRTGAIARVALDVGRLSALVPLPMATPDTLIADLRAMTGWPR